MNFQNPIPRATPPRFSELSTLASLRESQSNAKAWKKNQRNTSQIGGSTQALQRMQRQINAMRGRKLSSQVWHPFKVYTPQLGLYGATSNSFMVRDGLVAFRASYDAGTDVQLPSGERVYTTRGSDGVGTDVYTVGGVAFNWATVDPTTDYITPVGTVTAKDVTADSGDVSATADEPVLFNISTDVKQYALGTVKASFFIKITDAVDGSTPGYAKIVCRLYGADYTGYPSIPIDPWPMDEPVDTIIPIALLISDSDQVPVPNTFIIEKQFCFDNLIQRYAPTLGRYRGYWNDGLLDGQYFYVGDTVTYTNVGDTAFFEQVRNAPGTSSDPADSGWDNILALKTSSLYP